MSDAGPKMVATVRTVFRVEEGYNSIEGKLDGWHSPEQLIALTEGALRDAKLKLAAEKGPPKDSAYVPREASFGVQAG